MGKNTVILSVSIPVDDAKFLDDQQISASGIFQDKIKEIRRFMELNSSEKLKLQKNIEAYQGLILEYNEFMTQSGLKLEDFADWRGKRKQHGNN